MTLLCLDVCLMFNVCVGVCMCAYMPVTICMLSVGVWAYVYACAYEGVLCSCAHKNMCRCVFRCVFVDVCIYVC